MNYFEQIHSWATDVANCCFGSIAVKKDIRRKILTYILSVLESLDENSRKQLIKELKEYLIYN